MHTSPYTYKATVVSVYDGDTMTVDIDLGFRVQMRMVLRLYGINTPEVRGPERESGLASRDWVRLQCPPGKEIVVESYKDKQGKYGRYLATIWLPSHDDLGTPVNMNDRLVDLGLAVEANY